MSPGSCSSPPAASLLRGHRIGPHHGAVRRLRRGHQRRRLVAQRPLAPRPSGSSTRSWGAAHRRQRVRHPPAGDRRHDRRDPGRRWRPPWASRAPAWLATLRRARTALPARPPARFDPLVAGGAAALVALDPDGARLRPMLDTPIVAFPFGVLVITCWFRDWNAEEPGTRPRPALTASAALFAGLFGWQAAVLERAVRPHAGGPGASRHRPGALRAALPYLVGGAVGVALSLSWTWWVYGELPHAVRQVRRTLRRVLGRRASATWCRSSCRGWPTCSACRSSASIGCLVALRDRFLRPLAAMALASVALYAVIFPRRRPGTSTGTTGCCCPPPSAGPTCCGPWSGEVRKVRPGERPAPRRSRVVVAIIVFVGAFGVLRADQAQRYIDDGHRAADAGRRRPFPAGQTDLATSASRSGPTPGSPTTPTSRRSTLRRRSTSCGSSAADDPSTRS